MKSPYKEYKNKKLKPGTILVWYNTYIKNIVCLIVLGYKPDPLLENGEKIYLWNIRGHDLVYEPTFFLSFERNETIKNLKIIE